MVETTNREAAHIDVQGVVQGVGFRPFVYQLAIQHNLTGWVCNTSEAVRINVEGPSESLQHFISDIRNKKPVRAFIESIAVSEQTVEGHTAFEIRESVPEDGKYQLISPDIATCPECRKELFDPSDRRYRYPFTNCTNCGPRFTIIEDIPYDRPLTTMKEFTMCPDCRKEYDDPMNRRFHAQPNACPACGPALTLLDSHGNPVEASDPITTTSGLLHAGKIVALKGLGGFLLACDATSESTVNLLRERKHRPSKPFAVMVSSIEEAEAHCDINKQEAELLSSPAAPIVLLRWKPDSSVCSATAPNNGYLGMMLPYTPLHHLLMKDTGLPLVMTSGNISEEPIVKDNAEALERLSGIADYFLVHNRDIYAQYDDSVTLVQGDTPHIVRRARGYAPYPVKVPTDIRPVLACGAELKNTFCLTRDRYAFVSQHIGDMENMETLEHYEKTVSLYKQLFRIEPEIIAYDMHPDYLSTRYAKELLSANPDYTAVPIQHHHAHIASCMADNGISEPVIGVSFDGTGLGPDGNIWGGEFMTADYSGFQRIAHFEYLPLPGGDAATRKPYRITAGYLYTLFGDSVFDTALPFLQYTTEEELTIIREQIVKKINSPLTSSCGRLFDAVSALLGIRAEIDYEAQAAIELQMIADSVPDEHGIYRYTTDISEDITVIRFKELFLGILADLHNGTENATIASRFHNTIAGITRDMCDSIAGTTGIRNVALSGGVFQNRLLLRKTIEILRTSGFTVYTHRQVPTNDGGISLGQAVIAGFSR